MNIPQVQILREGDPVTDSIIDATITQDNLQNIVTGMGFNHHEEDKWRNTYLNFDFYQLEDALRTSWLARKVIQIIPEDMAFKWRKFTGSATPEQFQQITDRQKRLCVRDMFREAQESARLYGTGFIVLNIDGTGEPSEPLDWNNIKPGSFRSLVLTDRRHLHYTGIITTDPFDDNYYRPEYYHISESAVKIHNTRVLRFEANELPLFQFKINQYCSDSVLVNLENPIKQFEKTAQAAASLVDESSVDILKIKGLFDAFGDPEAEKSLRAHVRNIKRTKSNYNMTVLDSEDDYVSTGAQNLQGLDSLMLRFLQNISAAVDIPITRFLQTSPSGLQATGSSEERKYADTIHAQQEKKWRRNLEKIDKLTAIDLGLGIDLDSHMLDFVWESIIHLEESDKLENDRKWLNNMDQMVASGLIDEVIYAKDLYQRNISSNFSLETVKEIEAAVASVESESDLHSRHEQSISAKIETPDNPDDVLPNQKSTKTAGVQKKPKGNTKRDESGTDKTAPKTKNTTNKASKDECIIDTEYIQDAYVCQFYIMEDE